MNVCKINNSIFGLGQSFIAEFPHEYLPDNGFNTQRRLFSIWKNCPALIYTQTGKVDGLFGLSVRAAKRKGVINLRCEGVNNPNNHPITNMVMGIVNSASCGYLLRNKRCLVPVSHFFVAESSSDFNRPFLVKQSNGAIMYLGGIYDIWSRPGTDTGLLTFSLLTIPSAGLINRTGFGRMPLFVEEHHHNRWLGKENIDWCVDLMRTSGCGDVVLHGVLPQITRCADSVDLLKPF